MKIIIIITNIILSKFISLRIHGSLSYSIYLLSVIGLKNWTVSHVKLIKIWCMAQSDIILQLMDWNVIKFCTIKRAMTVVMNTVPIATIYTHLWCTKILIIWTCATVEISPNSPEKLWCHITFLYFIITFARLFDMFLLVFLSHQEHCWILGLLLVC